MANPSIIITLATKTIQRFLAVTSTKPDVASVINVATMIILPLFIDTQSPPIPNLSAF
jgi:surface polysaccharide O-acyltransferase-like enzyme